MRIRPRRRPPRWLPRPWRQRFRLGGGGAEKKNLEFYEKTEKRKIAKNLRKIEQNHYKRRFWRSCAQTDVTIEFYAKNYPYRLIFKSVRLKIAENRFLASSDHPWQNNNCCLFLNISLKKCKQNVQPVFSFIFATDGIAWGQVQGDFVDNRRR